MQILAYIVASLVALFSPTQASFVRAETMPEPIVLAATSSAPMASSTPEAPVKEAAPKRVPAEKEDAVLCNCYAYLLTRIPYLPHMADIVPNGSASRGAVAVLYYHDKHTGEIVKHVALIEEMTAEGFRVAESNFSHCRFDRRVIAWDDPHLAGFFVENAG